MLRKDGIRETKGGKFSSKPTGSDISIVVNANHNIITSIQRSFNTSKKISIKDGAGIRRGDPLEVEVSEMLVPDRAQTSRVPTRPVSREEGNRGTMLALKPNVGPTAKTSRISPMGCFMGQEGVVDGESSASSLVPSSIFSGVVGEVGVGIRRSPSNSSRKEIIRKESSLIETGFSIEGETGVAFGKGPGIEPGSGGGA